MNLNQLYGGGYRSAEQKEKDQQRLEQQVEARQVALAKIIAALATIDDHSGRLTLLEAAASFYGIRDQLLRAPPSYSPQALGVAE